MSAIVENAVGGLIASEVDGVIGMVVSRINDEIKLAWGFKKELEELKVQFSRLNGLLAGVSDKPVTNPLFADWLNSINDLASDAEDLLDEWFYEVCKKQVRLSLHSTEKDKLVTKLTYLFRPISTRFRFRSESSMFSFPSTSRSSSSDMDELRSSFCNVNRLSSSFCDTGKLLARVKYPISRIIMGHKVRDLRKSISSIYNVAKELGIKPIKVAAREVYSSVEYPHEQQRLWVGDEVLIGRQEDASKLVNWICYPTNTNLDLHVVAIVGLAGLGKTSLSKRVSKAEEVSSYFNSLVIWLVVSHSFDLINCLNGMVEILFGTSSNMRYRQALILKLQEKLKGKKYLLVLDDVWDATFWESLKLTLNEIGGSKGSTVLVTSRDLSVVAEMETYSCDSEGKITTNSPSIHMLKGLSESNSWSLFVARINDDNLANSEKEIVARRMIKSCGGVPLAIRVLGDLLRDKSVGRWMEIEKSDTWKIEDEYGILPSLRLSYDYLPTNGLKKCFAFCAIFEEDEVIEKEKLICMWMAHGFLQPYDKMELIGEEYFKFLLNNSLFQEPEKDKYWNVTTFKIVLSLARVVSREECSHKQNAGSSPVLQFSSKVRHLSLDHIRESPTCFKKLRTLFHEMIVLDQDHTHILKCRNLRVLRVQGFNERISMVLLLSGCLKHLRYLQIDNLPAFKSKDVFLNTQLYNLQTLWIGELQGEHFPLKGIGGLVNLRHLHCGSTFGLPEGLGRLTALQTLPLIDLGRRWGGRMSDLGLLKNLKGTFGICSLEYVNSEKDGSAALFCIPKLKTN